jgi:multisubunit Na+/H+ antiporter MnhB subunit
VKSILLQELAALILPLAVMLGISLTLKGHDAPGGGFVGGLSLAVAGVLGFSAWGTRAFRDRVRLPPERIALLGALLLLVSALLPLLAGDPMLTHRGLTLVLPLVGKLKLQSALVFDVGVVMVVGGGLAAAAIWLWDLAAPTASSETTASSARTALSETTASSGGRARGTRESASPPPSRGDA